MQRRDGVVGLLYPGWSGAVQTGSSYRPTGMLARLPVEVNGASHQRVNGASHQIWAIRISATTFHHMATSPPWPATRMTVPLWRSTLSLSLCGRRRCWHQRRQATIDYDYSTKSELAASGVVKTTGNGTASLSDSSHTWWTAGTGEGKLTAPDGTSVSHTESGDRNETTKVARPTACCRL